MIDSLICDNRCGAQLVCDKPKGGAKSGTGGKGAAAPVKVVELPYETVAGKGTDGDGDGDELAIRLRSHPPTHPRYLARTERLC